MSDRGDGDSSDALRRLAEGRETGADEPEPAARNDPPGVGEDAAGGDGDAGGFADTEPTSPGTPASRSRSASKASRQRLAAAGIAAAGGLFLLPAAWGLLFTLGLTEMLAERDNAAGVAAAAIVLGGAFGGVMFAAAGYLWWHAKRG